MNLQNKGITLREDLFNQGHLKTQWGTIHYQAPTFITFFLSRNPPTLIHTTLYSGSLVFDISDLWTFMVTQIFILWFDPPWKNSKTEKQE